MDKDLVRVEEVGFASGGAPVLGFNWFIVILRNSEDKGRFFIMEIPLGNFIQIRYALGIEDEHKAQLEKIFGVRTNFYKTFAQYVAGGIESVAINDSFKPGEHTTVFNAEVRLGNGKAISKVIPSVALGFGLACGAEVYVRRDFFNERPEGVSPLYGLIPKNRNGINRVESAARIYERARLSGVGTAQTDEQFLMVSLYDIKGKMYCLPMLRSEALAPKLPEQMVQAPKSNRLDDLGLVDKIMAETKTAVSTVYVVGKAKPQPIDFEHGKSCVFIEPKECSVVLDKPNSKPKAIEAPVDLAAGMAFLYLYHMDICLQNGHSKFGVDLESLK